MSNGRAEGDPRLGLPPALEEDYRRFRSELERVAGGDSGPPEIGRLLGQPVAMHRLVRFATLLYEQSERLALVGRADRSRLFTRHMLDSLNPLSLFARSPNSLLDVGSGGGFPGVPLALVWPETRVTLLESRERKAGFLERVLRELDARNAIVVCGRLEEAGASWKVEPVEAVTIRAVGNLPALLLAASRIAAPGATWVYFLGDADRAEPLLGEIAAREFEPRAIRGAMGGWLLTGRFRVDTH